MAERTPGPLAGWTMLVVEDDYLIAADLARSLEELGAAVVGPVGSVAGAMALLEDAPSIRAAVLDVNLGEERVFPLADELRRRQVPFVLATGYDAWILPPEYRSAPRFHKPLDLRVLVQTLQGLAA